MKHLYVNQKKSKNNIIVIGLCIYYLSLPFGTMGLFQLGSVLKFVAIVPIGVFLMRKETNLSISKISLFQLLYTSLLFFSAFYSINVSATLQRAKTNSMFCILLVFMGSVLFEEAEITKLRSALIWSSRITCGLMLIFGTTSSDRLLLSGIITEDPNYLNGYLLFGVINAMQIIIKNANRKKKFIAMIENIFYIYASLATGSRGGLFCLIAGALTVFLFEKVKGNELREIVKKLGILVLIAVIVIVVIRYLPSSVPARFEMNSIIASRGTNRFGYWQNAITIFELSPISKQLFGYGAATMPDIFGKFGYMSVVAHNIFVEQLLEIGIVGLLIYSIIIVYCLMLAKKKNNIFGITIMVGFIVLSLSTSLYAFKPYWNVIIFINLLHENKVKNDLKITIPSTKNSTGLSNLQCIRDSCR